MTDRLRYWPDDEENDGPYQTETDPTVVPQEGETVLFNGLSAPTGVFVVERRDHIVNTEQELKMTDIYVRKQ